MTTRPEPRRRRGTPISDSLGADLHTLGSILATHTRGLDDYLQRQAGRIEERHGRLLSETADLLLPPGVDLNSLTAGELQNLCRKQRLRGWSKLRRSELIAFLQERGHAAEAPAAVAVPSLPYPPEASRTERLLLLLLRQLGTTTEAIEGAWWDPGQPKR
ncbi:hypothetical protein H6G65_16060 [Microcystis elabens FACHB-917]|nr:hypothetical protein [Microcystis elabens FACHB-917]